MSDMNKMQVLPKVNRDCVSHTEKTFILDSFYFVIHNCVNMTYKKILSFIAEISELFEERNINHNFVVKDYENVYIDNISFTYYKELNVYVIHFNYVRNIDNKIYPEKYSNDDVYYFKQTVRKYFKDISNTFFIKNKEIEKQKYTIDKITKILEQKLFSDTYEIICI